MSYLLAAWLCIPSFLMALFMFSSLSIGVIGMSVVAMFLTLSLNLKRRPRIDKLYPAFLTVSILSILLSHFLADQPFSEKQGYSIIGLVVLAFGASTFFHYYFSRKAKTISRSMKYLYLFFVLIGLIGIVLPVSFGPYSSFANPVFPFIEPSHYALAYSQVASIALPFLRGKDRFWVVLTTFLLAFSLPNATMLVIALLLLAVTASVRLLVTLLMTLIVVIVFIAPLAPNLFGYFTDRLSADTEAVNLSRLVYIQGWESMFSALSTTHGLGIGFQNLGNEPLGETGEFISKITADNSTLNRADGGFLLAKLGGEFGVVGILTALSLLVMSIWSGKVIRQKFLYRNRAKDALLIMPLCSTYILFAEILIRGVGYFSPTLILAIYFIPLSLNILRNRRLTGLTSIKLDRRRDKRFGLLGS